MMNLRDSQDDERRDLRRRCNIRSLLQQSAAAPEPTQLICLTCYGSQERARRKRESGSGSERQEGSAEGSRKEADR